MGYSAEGDTRGEGAYVDGADEVFVAHEDIGHAKPEEDGQDPGSDETLDRLLGRELDELRAAESNAADVRKYVVGDYKRGWKEEPDHAFEDVVHDKV